MFKSEKNCQKKNHYLKKKVNNKTIFVKSKREKNMLFSEFCHLRKLVFD